MHRLILSVAMACLETCLAAQVSPSGRRAMRAFEAAKSSPLELHAFLARMPKGADLHMHLSGAIYAETFVQDAVSDGLCVDLKALAFVKNIGTAKSIPPLLVCAEGQVPASAALHDQHLYDELVDSFSMRSFVPTPGTSGHDQFFASFARFGGIDKNHAGEWLDEVASRAAAQNEQYLEIMQTPTFSVAAGLGYKLGWPEVLGEALGAKAEGAAKQSEATTSAFSHLRDQLLADPAFGENVAADRKQLADDLALRTKLEHCGQQDAVPACSVQIKFLGQILRAFPPQQVFAQTLLYFELASSDPDVIGINYVQPEDAYMAMSEYHRQMLMLDYLHGVYPKVHISLHAGEIAPGLVPPEGVRFHIREAVELGHAERIGHGVDVMYEDNPAALLKEMADRHVMVEINLTSNDVILGVKANQHSLPSYRAAHVPVALSTDDEGVSRIDLTHEYARAAVDFGLTYASLKDLARTSLEHSFLAGPSLWRTPDDFTRSVPACSVATENPSAVCAAFLAASDKAAQQWELEHRFKAFETSLP